jgi:hypothetical protein
MVSDLSRRSVGRSVHSSEHDDFAQRKHLELKLEKFLIVDNIREMFLLGEIDVCGLTTRRPASVRAERQEQILVPMLLVALSSEGGPQMMPFQRLCCLYHVFCFKPLCSLLGSPSLLTGLKRRKREKIKQESALMK